MTSRIAVIGDVHGNAAALRAALHATEQAGRLVFLGDLLSYGPDVETILDEVEGALKSRDITLIRGNHDQYYEDLADGGAGTARLPGWIQESVSLVAARLDVARFRQLPWQDECSMGSVLLAHANPFGVGDWTYLNDVEDHARAADVLRGRGAGVGVFAHTHRARCYHDDRGAFRLETPSVPLRVPWTRLIADPWVLNAGSIGQPREADKTVYVLWLTIDAEGCAVEFEPIIYDVAAHLDALRRAPLSEETRRRLLAFHLAD